ncbi:hypothetical protein GUJ93_ZPchr0006g42062 [Zizania palustris]|uniref:Uncharacterized protein n=1 Tax=Zizania palustris TaxID=103762 RepID=A0A8J5W3T0_ZIZPA|nr:hypothetical protein GUJ93_ZPchr0006g42062 [Zizania palustris]
MEPKHSAEMSKHLDKQNQVLMETYRAMSHELHKLQVEEETIMHKLYEMMSAEGLLPKDQKEMMTGVIYFSTVCSYVCRHFKDITSLFNNT